MTWPLITFMVLWLLTSALLVFMQAATPSTERVSNGDLIALVVIAAVASGLGTLMLVGVITLITGAV